MAKMQVTTIHSLFRESRQRKYKTARDFWEEHQKQIGASYPHYSAVEKGTKFPDIQLAIAIARCLKLDLKLVCHLWAKDQMPDAETQSFFEPVPGMESQGLPNTVHMQLDEYFVFTEKQIPALEANPAIWDVLMLIMSFWDTAVLNQATVHKVLGLPRASVDSAVEWLRNEGLIYSEDGVLKARRRYYHLPNTEAFSTVRNVNFKNASEDILRKLTPDELLKKEAYRTTFTRQLSRPQAIEISKHIDQIIGHVGNMKDEGEELYSLTVAFGSRARVLKNKPTQLRATS